MPASDPTFGVYVHWPFCESKCPYCDFNSHVRERVAEDRWRAAYRTEIAAAAAAFGRRRVDTVFFGGGTPSRMHPDTVAAVLDAIGAGFEIAADAEITLEANPASAEVAKFRDVRSAGVNRLSLGVQSLDDDALRFLGRAHDAAAARAALAAALAVFPRVSFDLIYALPGQTRAAWRAELTEALGLGGGHLSAYQLTLETGTPFFHAAAAGKLVLPGDDDAAALYDLTQQLCDAAGLPAYEVSNHARDGEQSRHNLLYWRSRDWAGIGPGAHGRQPRSTGAPPAPATTAASATPFELMIRFGPGAAPGGTSSDPVHRIATRGRRRTSTVPGPIAASSPISRAPRRRPARSGTSPAAKSMPRGRTFLPVRAGSVTRTRPPSAGSVFSWITTVSAPPGNVPPVKIRTAWPGATVPAYAPPAGAAPTTRSSTGAVATSAPRTA